MYKKFKDFISRKFNPKGYYAARGKIYPKNIEELDALVNDPKILFLDEPTLGLDVISRKELWDIIKSKKGNMTIILTTHYMEEAEKLSDRIGIMSNGVLKRVGTASQLKAMEKVETFEEAFIKIATDEVLYENN